MKSAFSSRLAAFKLCIKVAIVQYGLAHFNKEAVLQKLRGIIENAASQKVPLVVSKSFNNKKRIANLAGLILNFPLPNKHYYD